MSERREDDETSPNERSVPRSSEIPPPDVLELDPVYDALSHPRRRYLCYTLLEDTAWTLTELARKIAAWEDDVPEEDVASDRRDGVYVSLFHTHVPKLAESGVVSFEEGDEVISYADGTEQVLTALQALGASFDVEQEEHARREFDDDRAQ